MLEARTVSVSIARTAADVYDYAADPSHLPDWSFFDSVTPAGDAWTAVVPGGDRVTIRFTAGNHLGVLDHTVELPGGEVVPVVMRVVPNGAGSELLFTVFRRPGGTDADLDADIAAVRTDLTRLKQHLEA